MYILFVIETETRQVHYTRIHATLAEAQNDMNTSVAPSPNMKWEIQVKRPTGADLVRILPIITSTDPIDTVTH
jgi:hypothetical protein